MRRDARLSAMRLPELAPLIVQQPVPIALNDEPPLKRQCVFVSEAAPDSNWVGPELDWDALDEWIAGLPMDWSAMDALMLQSV